MTSKSKITLFDFDGTPRKTYSVSMEKFTPDPSEVKKKLGNQIIVVDRSGSMYYDIEALKDTVIKVLTLNEFEDSDMIVSLISYSSEGDVTLHFERVPVSEVMRPGSEHLQEVKSIEATFLTCISQAMTVAEGLINDEEVTGIILHSDGYANDPSPRHESSELDSICERLSKHDVFVNTVAYSSYSDFVLLSRVASSVSGKCVKANTTKEVYEALAESCQMISSGQSAVAEIPIGESDYVMFMSKEPQRIIGGEGDLVVKGVGESNYLIFRFTESELDKSAIASDAMSRTAMYGMAYARLASGHINDAKMFMLSSLNADLIDNHIRALAPNQLADMSTSLAECVFSRSSAEFYTDLSSIEQGSSILDVVSILDENRHDILLNVEKLRSSYIRRGLRKVAGKREKDGTVTVPLVDTKIADDNEFVKMGSFDINRDSATINMQIERRCNLIDRDTGKVIHEVAGILLDNLKDYKKYTIVGDGEVNLSSMFVKFSTKEAFDSVRNIGAVSGEYSHSQEYEIKLSEMPVSSLTADMSVTKDDFEKIALLNIASRALNELSKGKSSEYTAEQVEELKRHCLSDSLYVNIPMMNEHDDLDEAIASGDVDSRTAYKIGIGTTEILNVSKFKSANAFLERMYVVTRMDENMNQVEEIEKPKFGEVFFDKSVSFSHKKLSARTKVTHSDNMQKAVFDEILDFSEPDFLKVIAGIINVPELVEIGWRHSLGEEETTKIVERAKRAIASKERELWATVVSPLIFHIGSTGIMPKRMNAKAMTPEEIMEKHDGLNLTKAEKEGIFFEIDGIVISVFATQAHFSVDRKKIHEDKMHEKTVTA
jgi:Mg-chelatase subunit ChlD